MNTTHTLVLGASAQALEALTPLAREGLRVTVAAGRTLRETLTSDLGLLSQYVEERVQTVFLDGSPVDNIDTDHARPGSTLALAGAMPGVAGIAMRRGSPVGVFREGITHQDAPALPASAAPLQLTLKLFNNVAVECVAQVVARGVLVRAGRLAELLEDNPDALAQAAFALDGKALDRSALVSALRGSQELLRLEARW